MSTTNPTRNEPSGPDRIEPDHDAADRAVPCMDLALDYAPDHIMIDFEAWCAARDATATTLRRLAE